MKSESTSQPPPLKRQCKKYWLNSGWKLEAVLQESLLRPIPLVEVFVCRVRDPKQTSSLIRKINDVAPIASLQHLKRVKSSKNSATGGTSIFLLLWEVVEEDNESVSSMVVMNKLEKLGVDIAGLDPEVHVERVASSQPVTRWQFEHLRTGSGGAVPYWPSNFHPDKYIEGLLEGSLDEIWGGKAREVQEGLLTNSIIQEKGGGLVVETVTGNIVAAGHGTLGHPLHHTAINLIDLVARSQGGGAMSHSDTAVTPSFFFSQSSCSQTSLSLSPPDSPTGYLCTGYDVYLAQEPCHMCAMALLHSRTNRIFCLAQSKDGALIEDKLHTREGLNHKYEVYRVVRNEVMPDEEMGWCT
jgi:tRNA-specific adenosine deaminase 3